MVWHKLTADELMLAVEHMNYLFLTYISIHCQDVYVWHWVFHWHLDQAYDKVMDVVLLNMMLTGDLYTYPMPLRYFSSCHKDGVTFPLLVICITWANFALTMWSVERNGFSLLKEHWMTTEGEVVIQIHTKLTLGSILYSIWLQTYLMYVPKYRTNLTPNLRLHGDQFYA